MLIKRKFYLIFLSVLILTTIICSVAEATPVLTDIQNHWAAQKIQTLLNQGVIDGYPDGTFKPNQAVTRAEFAKMVAKNSKLDTGLTAKFPDTTEHWANSYIGSVSKQKFMNSFADNYFKPDQAVTRAQLATILMRILNLARSEEKYTDKWSNSFVDLPSDHWAFHYVELANKLKIFPNNYQTEFLPNQPATRAEASWILQTLNQLEISKGKITSVDTGSGLVNLQATNGEPRLSMVTPDTIIMRNNLTNSIDSLLTNDEVTTIATAAGDVKYLKAFGPITKNDTLSRISSFTKGYLNKDQINSLIAGDWNSIKDNLKGELYNRMIEFGLTPAEAESIIVKDWNYLDTLSRDRLTAAIAKQLGITQELSQALIERDLNKIKDYGKIELASAALTRFLGKYLGE